MQSPTPPSTAASTSSSRQPTETIPQFLARLPPAQAESTFPPDQLPPWYHIHNPHCSSANGIGIGDIESFKREGEALLRSSAMYLAQGSREEKEEFREGLKREIGEVARRWGVTAGKWMLFPQADQVNEVWEKVCEGVDANRLGTGAKVSTSSKTSQKPEDPARLICVYTKDFTDVADVKRVLLALEGMGLIRTDISWGTLYKCDAYTYLGIYSGNHYGLPASIYKSNDMLAEMDLD